MADSDEQLSIKPVCLSQQDQPCLLAFNCDELDSPTISNRIITHLSNKNYDYIMPDCNKHNYVFSNNNTTVTCYLFKPVILNTVTVCFVPAEKNRSSHQLFCELRDLFRPHIPSVFGCVTSRAPDSLLSKSSNMSALDLLLKHY